MEELTAALATSFSVSQELNTTAAEHPRFSQYKLKLSPSQRQEARRRKILEIQKKAREDANASDSPISNLAQTKHPGNSRVSSSQGSTGRRFDFSNHARKLTEGVWEENDNQTKEDNKEEDDGGEEAMEVQTSLRKPGRYYKDQLMYSEWLVEVPNDFETEWLMVVCPVGKRRLVVSARGQTTSYSKGGFRCMNFPSNLPGGNRSNLGKRQYADSVILDCVYCERSKTYYVLDMMYWKNMPIYDSETEFRFYWMHEKLQETELVSVVRKTNPYPFIPLPSFPCTATAISNAISCANFDIDGLLFYHKRTHYTFGPTPLVVWLKTYMVPDVLNIAVPYREVAKAPPSYVNYTQHLETVKNQIYGSPPEKDRQASSRGRGGRGRGRGRGGRGGSPGRGRRDGIKEKSMDASDSVEGDGSADNRQDQADGGKEKSMDASDSVEGDGSAGNSLNSSEMNSASDTTPQTEPGIIRMPKDFNFDTSPTSPFSPKVTSPESHPTSDSPKTNVQVMSPAEAIEELNARNTSKASEKTEQMSVGENNEEGSPGKKSKSKKVRNRGRKGRGSKMDTSDGK